MMEVQEKGQGEFEVTIREKTDLHKHYMHWSRQGGLFILTRQTLELRDPVKVHLTLPEEAEPTLVIGTVVWITPPNPAGQRQQGIGVHFADDEAGQALRNRIEGLIAGMNVPTRASTTL